MNHEDTAARNTLTRTIGGALMAGGLIFGANALADHHRAGEQEDRTDSMEQSAAKQTGDSSSSKSMNSDGKQSSDTSGQGSRGKGASMSEDDMNAQDDRRGRAEVTGSIASEYPTTARAKYQDTIEGAKAWNLPAMRASKLIGTTVRSAEGESIGEISDLVIVGGERDIRAIISVGGFLGIGDKLVAIPYGRLTQSKGNEGDLQLDETRSALKDMKSFRFNRDGRADDSMSSDSSSNRDDD